MSSEFKKDLERLINYHSKENGSNTPDFILANYLIDCLAAFDMAVNMRENWYCRKPVEVKEPVLSLSPLLTSLRTNEQNKECGYIHKDEE